MGAGQSSEQEWVQDIVVQLSPRFGEFASDVLSEQVEPLVQKVLSKSKVPNVHFQFEKTDFGTVPPQLSNFHTHKTREAEAKSITTDFDVNYLGDCDLQVSMMGIHSGVRDVQIAGRARFVLKPTTKSLPLIGGLQMFFLDPPSIDFDLAGIADVADWQGIRGKVRKEIIDDTCKKCVYPNKVIIPMSQSTDPMLLKCFDPIGVLAVRIHSAMGLPKKKGLRSLVGQDKPDPYVKINVGAVKMETPVVKNKTDPVWDEELWYEFPLETLKGFRLNLKMFDKDSMSRDEFLGKVVIDVADNIGAIGASFTLEEDENEKTKYDAITGSVEVSMMWLPLSPTPPNELSYNGSTRMVVTVFVYSCNNLTEFADGSTVEGVPTTRLVCSMAGLVSKSEKKKNTQHPEFQEGFTFPVGEGSEELGVHLEVLEENGSTFGEHKVFVNDIMENPIRRQVFPLSDERPHVTITLSANVKFLSDA